MLCVAVARFELFHSAPSPSTLHSPCPLRLRLSFLQARCRYDVDYCENRKGKLKNATNNSLAYQTMELIQYFEGFLDKLPKEVEAYTHKPEGVMYHPGSHTHPLRHCNLWQQPPLSKKIPWQQTEPTICLRLSKGKSPFCTNLTWSEMYAFIFALRCILVHADPVQTLVTGCFPQAQRERVRHVLTHAANAKKKCQNHVQWAKDTLMVLDMMEGTLPAEYHSGPGIKARQLHVSFEQMDSEACHWFFRTWFSRMVARLAATITESLVEAGWLPKGAATEFQFTRAATPIN